MQITLKIKYLLLLIVLDFIFINVTSGAKLSNNKNTDITDKEVLEITCIFVNNWFTDSAVTCHLSNGSDIPEDFIFNIL